MKNDQQSVIVLGATGGLAEATLEWLSNAGVHLVLHGRNEEALAARVDHLSGSGVGLACVAGDVQDPQLGARLWEAAAGLPGLPVGLVCFVGVPLRVPPEEWTPDALAGVFAINTAAPLLLARDFSMRIRSAGHGGNIVLFSTMQALYPFEGSLPYAASKAALERGVEILAKEYGDAPVVRVNAIAPGVNEAGMALSSIAKGKYQPYLDAQTIPRFGRSADVARAVCFLLSPDLYMTGQTLLFDGGLTLRRDMS